MDPEHKYKRIYNPNSNRCQNHDYSEEWFYFITICTKDRQNFLWNIVGWKMILNWMWEIVENDILKLSEYHENLEIDEFIVMPNHIHMIMILKNKNVYTICRDVSQKRLYNSLNKKFTNDNWKGNFSKISPKKWSIWNILKLFKWFLTKKLNKSYGSYIFNFAWQSNYYDRIIRGEKELFNIRKYIQENPQKWELDENNLDNF